MGSVVYYFEIVKGLVTKPTLSSNEFTYDTNPHTVTLNQTGVYTISGDVTKTNVGNYTVTVALDDKDNYAWSDDTTTDLTFTYKINKASYDMSGVTLTSVTVTYDGNSHSLAYAGTLPNGVTVKEYIGNAKVEVGEYTITLVFNVVDEDNYNIPASLSATLKIVAPLPTITDGEDGEWSSNSNTGYSMVIDGDKNAFIGIKVNNVQATQGIDYEIDNDTFTITFKPDFLKSLGSGTHTVDILFTDDVVISTTLTTTGSTPRKGLGVGAIIGIILGSLAIVGLGGFSVYWFILKKKSFSDLMFWKKNPSTPVESLDVPQYELNEELPQVENTEAVENISEDVTNNEEASNDQELQDKDSIEDDLEEKTDN
jgi:hypothetical protein